MKDFTVFLFAGMVGATLGAYACLEGGLASHVVKSVYYPHNPALGAFFGTIIALAFFTFLRVSRFRIPFAPGWIPCVVAFLCWLLVPLLVYWQERNDAHFYSTFAVDEFVASGLVNLPAFIIVSYIVTFLLYGILVVVLGLPWPERDAWKD